MKNKALVMTAIIVIVIVLAGAVAWPLMARRMGPPQRKPGSLTGEWTANIPSAGVSVYKWGTLSRAPRLGFGDGGHEIIMAWVPMPHHPRPIPVEANAQYYVQGSTLVQSVRSRSNIFDGLGLAAVQSKSQTTLTSQFAISGNKLILTQPQSGKSTTFTLTALALPPSSPSGAGPAGKH